MEAASEARLAAEVASFRDLYKQVQYRNEVSDRACRACNVVLFGIQDTLGDILTQVLPLTWAKMALHSSTNKDLRSNIHMEFWACQALLVDECRAILAKAIDRHTTYAPMPSHLAKRE